ASKSLMYRDAVPCSGPGLLKCLGCSAEHYGRAKGPAVALANRVGSALECSQVDLFIAVSEATARGNGLTGDRPPLRVIPNFVLDQADAPTLELAPYLARLPDEPFLLFVGDLRRFKGVDVLLEAYRALRGAPPLVLIGKVWPDTPAALP